MTTNPTGGLYVKSFLALGTYYLLQGPPIPSTEACIKTLREKLAE